MRILAISGSLHTPSSTTAVLDTALETLDPSTWTATHGDIGALPHFNQNLDREGAAPQPAVAALRSAVADTDALLFVSPEYAHGMPGVLKNAIDWLAGSGALEGRPTAVVTASGLPAGGVFAYDHLRESLGKLGARIVEDACLRVPELGTKVDRATGRVTHEPTRAELASALAALATAAQS
ncbi:NADPH-dependent FMN reductase [Streptomyces sp. NPDC057702]|uniref:NADPH-dependent FMN reductase n=1 Tax=unclassified Streptomyces TaxID=2593676 RepID=UPI0036C326E3